MFKMDLQLFGVTLPENPSPSQATVGKDYLLYVNTGTVSVPVWTLIGGQRGSSLGRKADSIDASNKTSGGWGTTLAGLKKWNVDLSGLAMLNDLGLEALETAFDASENVNVKFLYPDLRYRTGWASITELSIDTPHDGAATLKGTLEGNGPLSALYPAVDPLTATVSKAAATDLTFTIAPSSTTITGIKNGADSLTNVTDYSYSAGTLTIESTYLAGLTVGTNTLTITTGDGTTPTITLTVTA